MRSSKLVRITDRKNRDLKKRTKKKRKVPTFFDSYYHDSAILRLDNVCSYELKNFAGLDELKLL